MRYKVGDTVRVRKDLEAKKFYGSLRFADVMEKYKGKTFTIAFKNTTDYRLEENGYWWNDEMLEPVEDIIEYKGKKYDVMNEFNRHIVDIDLDIGKSTREEHDELILTLTEHKEEILDEEEKEYLRNVIKYVIEPTHNEVKSIAKQPSNACSTYYISISYFTDDYLLLPDFTNKRMYKGMELCKEYTVKDLGLDK